MNLRMDLDGTFCDQVQPYLLTRKGTSLVMVSYAQVQSTSPDL